MIVFAVVVNTSILDMVSKSVKIVFEYIKDLNHEKIILHFNYAS